MDPADKKFTTITIIVTLVILIILIIVEVILYFKRAFIFAPYKPSPPKNTNVNPYYPNGKPESSTGKPAGSAKINNQILSQINTNLTIYKTSNPSANPDDWGYAGQA